MAIYSLNLRSIGRTTHPEGTAGAHLGYITRAGACRLIVAEHMPTADPGSRGGEAAEWMNDQELADRKNARVCDKVMLALPVELDQAARVELVHSFMAELTGGVAVPWFAAFHDVDRKSANPHCHLVIRDRAVGGGKRVIGMSSKGAADKVRLAWETVTNAALEAAGASARIDRRSLLAQSADRDPTQHQGPTAQQIEAKGRQSTKLQRIEAKTKPRIESMAAARRDRQEREARETGAATEALKAAMQAEEDERAAEALGGPPEGVEPAMGFQEATRADNALKAVNAAYDAAHVKLQRAHKHWAHARDTLEGRCGLFDHSENAALIQASSPPAWTPQARSRTVSRVKLEWRSELSWRRPELRRIEALHVPQQTPYMAADARETFDWMRRQMAAARSVLGQAHALYREMQVDWRNLMAETPRTRELIRTTFEGYVKRIENASLPFIEIQSQASWNEVKTKRATARSAAAPDLSPGRSR